MTKLGTHLCPWLRPALARLEAAHAEGRLGHAWLLAGPRGTGKINLALAFANRLLTRKPATSQPPELGPGEFVAAIRGRHVPTDHHPDLHWLFPEEDKRTISIEQIRATSEAVALKSFGGAAKVVIIEPADEMTPAAANALLKTLEEPCGDTYLLLITHQPERLPATIRSRCQRLAVSRPMPTELRSWVGAREVPALWLATGGSPLLVAAYIDKQNTLDNMVLENELIQISKDSIDPQSVAEGWFKQDCELVLSWLLRRIQLALQARLAPEASTAVTDQRADALHNAWATLTLRTLFAQHQAAELLLNQLGSGINVELALRALLLGFQQQHRGQL
jgi:DNA polymerase III subunit delta'